MARRSSIGPTFTVFGVWWFTTALLASSYNLTSMLQAASVVTIGSLLGFVGAIVSIVVIRVGNRGMTAPTELRGLKSSIGDIPMPAPPPARAETLPSISPVDVPDVDPDFIDNWLFDYEESFPAHAALFKALLQVLNHRPSIPATHIAGGHGGRTLLQHSLLAAFIMTKLSHTWVYTGLRDRNHVRVVLKLRDPDYKFNPIDPMVAIIGLAHDIGKIDAFIYDHTGKVVSIRAEHDMTGARMIARMDETWAIPESDRDAMLLAIAHYHHPVALPLAPDKRAVDDRTIALMELLIHADHTVSRVEYDNVMPTTEEYEALDSVRSASPEQLFDEFVALIHEANRVNSGNIRYSIGQVSPGPDEKTPLLYLHEESMRLHLMRRMSVSESDQTGDGRFQITIDLLNVLKARGLLYTTHDGLDFRADQSMWVCDVMGSKNQKVSHWPCAIAIRLDHFEKIRDMGYYSSSIKILRNRFGNHIGKIAKKGPVDSALIGKLGGPNDIPDAPPAKKKPKPATPAKSASTSAAAPQSPSAASSPPVDPKPQVSTPSVSAAASVDVTPPAQPKPEADVPDVAARVESSPLPVKVLDVQPDPEQPLAASTPDQVAGDPDPGNVITDGINQDLIASPAAKPALGDSAGTDNGPALNAEPNSQVVTTETPEEPQQKVIEQEPVKPISGQVDQVVEQIESKTDEADPDALKNLTKALSLVVSMGRAGQLKCKSGNKCLVFNLDTLGSADSKLIKALRSEENMSYLTAGKIDGVKVVAINPQLSLLSISAPLYNE